MRQPPTRAAARACCSAGRVLLTASTGSRGTLSSSAAGLASDAQRALDGHHRGAAGVDGVDDLGVVDALEVNGGDPEVGMPELALDDDQRHALAGHLDGVRVAQLVVVPTSAQASSC